MAEQANWYVAHTYSGYENAVKAAIEKSVVNRGMEDMVLKTEIPMETVTEVTETGVMKEVQRKVFPGYVLIKMVMTDDTWHLIRNIRGVTGFVGEARDRRALPCGRHGAYHRRPAVQLHRYRGGDRAGEEPGARGRIHVRTRDPR